MNNFEIVVLNFIHLFNFFSDIGNELNCILHYYDAVTLQLHLKLVLNHFILVSNIKIRHELNRTFLKHHVMYLR